MNLEDFIKKYLSDNSEASGALKKLFDGEVEGLKSKVSEVLEKNKKLRDTKLDLENKLEEIEDKVKKEELKRLKDDGKNDEVEKRLKEEYEEKLQKVLREKEDQEKQVNSYTIKNNLTEALLKNNIAKQHIGAVEAMIKMNNEIKVEKGSDGSPYAAINGKNLMEFVKEWSQGDVGKVYVAAQQNSGGGAQGSGQPSQGNVDLSKLTPSQKMAMGRKQQSK